jgi:hypothetical protein
MIRPPRLANENLRLPGHDHLRRQAPGPNVADQVDTITAPTSLDVALVPRLTRSADNHTNLA